MGLVISRPMQPVQFFSFFTPVNLGPVVNSNVDDRQPYLGPNRLTL